MRKKKDLVDPWETKDFDDADVPIKKMVSRDNAKFLDDDEVGESNWDPISSDGTELRVQGFTKKQIGLVERIVDMELRNMERGYTELRDTVEALEDERVTWKEKLNATKQENAKLRGKIVVLEAKLKAQQVKHEQELANLRGIDAHVVVRRPQMKRDAR